MEREFWIFTFGDDQPHPGYYVKIYGTWGEARSKMIERYGLKWGFQMSQKDWEKWEKERPWFYPVEKELKVIE